MRSKLLDEMTQKLSLAVSRPPGPVQAATGATKAVGRVAPTQSTRRATSVVSASANGVRVQVFGRPSPRYLNEVRAAARKGARSGLDDAAREQLS